MSRNGLTITIVFLAESANYGEGVGNITTLKKMTRGNYEQYSYISRQAMRYNIVQQLKRSAYGGHGQERCFKQRHLRGRRLDHAGGNTG